MALVVNHPCTEAATILCVVCDIHTYNVALVEFRKFLEALCGFCKCMCQPMTDSHIKHLIQSSFPGSKLEHLCV